MIDRRRREATIDTPIPTGTLDDLIEALTILRKYGNPIRPTHCEHDQLWICGIEPGRVSSADIERLDALGVFVDGDAFSSFVFGSAVGSAVGSA